MNELTDYKNHRSKNKTVKGLKQPFVDSFLENILYSFEYSPSYYQVTKIINGVENKDILYDTWILDDNAYKDDIGKKKILMKPNQTLDRGELINWENQLWLCVKKDPQKSYYDNGMIEKINYTLKWMNDNGKRIETPCVIQAQTRISAGMQENQQIIVGDSYLEITLPRTDETLKIKRDRRFLVSTSSYNPVGFRVTKADNATKYGLIVLTLSENGAQTNTATDDTTEMIPDRWKYESKHGYLFGVINKISSIEQGNTYQVTTISTDSGIDYIPNITYTSSDNSICTISNTGLISTNNIKKGNVTIIATDSISGLIDKFDLEIMYINYVVNIINKITYMNLGETYQLNVSASNDGIENPSPIIHYHSSDENILKINETGLLTALSGGEVDISVEYQGVKDTMSLSIIAKPNYHIDITSSNGLNSITVTSTITYHIKELNQNIELSGKSFDFSIDYHGLPSTIATLIFIDGQTCKIKCNSYNKNTTQAPYMITLNSIDKNDKIICGKFDITLKNPLS